MHGQVVKRLPLVLHIYRLVTHDRCHGQMPSSRSCQVNALPCRITNCPLGPSRLWDLPVYILHLVLCISCLLRNPGVANDSTSLTFHLQDAAHHFMQSSRPTTPDTEPAQQGPYAQPPAAPASETGQPPWAPWHAPLACQTPCLEL